VFVAIKRAVPQMGDNSRIINIGSINADRVPGTGLSVYAMTKAAIAGLTRGLARELAERGIAINNVQPGPIETDMNPVDGPFSESARGLLAVGHYGSASDVAGVVCYLARPDTSYITGANWNVDGGFTV
jgi:3-oxoacyl-[acyl-carrier protein] reductase